MTSHAAALGVGATGAVDKFATTSTQVSPFPASPTPINYVTWLAGLVPTVVAGISGLWGFLAGLLGLVFTIYAVLLFVSTATNRVVGAPLLSWLDSVSISADRETTTTLRELGSRKQRVFFVAYLLARWVAVTLLSVVAGLILFGVAVLTDAPTLVLLGLAAHSWMYFSAHTQPFMRLMDWTTTIIRSTFNFGVSGVNVANQVSSRWLTPMYNADVFATFALMFIFAPYVSVPSFSSGRVLQQQDSPPLTTPATHSPTSSAQTQLTNGVPATIPGADYVIRHVEPFISTYTTTKVGFQTAQIGLTDMVVRTAAPVFPAVVETTQAVAQVATCSLTWVGAQCHAREGLAYGLDKTGAFFGSFLSSIGVSAGSMEWGKGVKCYQSDAGASISCACSYDNGGVLTEIDRCCGTADPKCRQDVATGMWMLATVACDGNVVYGAKNALREIACGAFADNIEERRRLMRDTAWVVTAQTGAACTRYCDATNELVEICPLRFRGNTTSVVGTCDYASEVLSVPSPSPSPPPRRDLRSKLQAGSSFSSSSSVGNASRTHAAASHARTHAQRVAQAVREQLAMEMTDCAVGGNDGGSRHAETACLISVARRSHERLHPDEDAAARVALLAPRSELRRRALQHGAGNEESPASQLARGFARMRAHRLAESGIDRSRRRLLRAADADDDAGADADAPHASSALHVMSRFLGWRTSVPATLMGNGFVESAHSVVDAAMQPIQAELRARAARRALALASMRDRNDSGDADVRRRRTQTIPCPGGVFSSSTNCDCPYTCPDGTCAASGSQCVYPKQVSVGVLTEWYLLQAELFVTEMDPTRILASQVKCWNKIINDPEANPVSLANSLSTYDARLQNPKLQWCFPMIREWPFGSLPGSEFDFQVWVSQQCGSGVYAENPCACSSYFGFHYEVDVQWLDGVPYFQPTRWHDGILAGWHIFTRVLTRDTWWDHGWQMLFKPFYPIIPRWFANLWGDQGQKGSEGEQLLCAIFNFGTTLWVVFMVRVTSLLFVTAGYLAILRVMELVSIVEICLELVSDRFASVGSRQFRRDAKHAMVRALQRLRRDGAVAAATTAVASQSKRFNGEVAENQASSGGSGGGKIDDGGGDAEAPPAPPAPLHGAASARAFSVPVVLRRAAASRGGGGTQ